MWQRFIPVFSFFAISMLASAQLIAQPSTKKVRSRDLLVLERKRAEEAAAAHQREMEEMRARVIAAEQRAVEDLKERARAESAREREMEIEALKERYTKTGAEIAKSHERAVEELKTRLGKAEDEMGKLRAETETERNKRWFGAIRSGNIAVLEQMFKDGDARIEGLSTCADMCAVGFTSLVCAVAQNQPTVVSWLLAHKANVDGVCQIPGTHANNTTALMKAAALDSIHIASLLLANHANVNFRKTNAEADTGLSAVAHAAAFGGPDMIALLVEHGATLEAARSGWSPLRAAACRNRTDNLKKLLELGSPIPQTREEAQPIVDLLNATKDNYLTELWNATFYNKRNLFLAERRQREFLAIAEATQFPDAIGHIIFDLAIGPTPFVKPGDKETDIRRQLKLLDDLKEAK